MTHYLKYQRANLFFPRGKPLQEAWLLYSEALRTPLENWPTLLQCLEVWSWFPLAFSNLVLTALTPLL